MWSPISCVLPSLGRSGPSRAEVGVGFRFVRLVQALPSFPPLRWSCSVSVGLRFSFSLPFQGVPAPGQGRWCVFSPSLFFCVPLLGSRLSNHSFHFHSNLIFIHLSSSSSPHCKDTTLPKAGCVCVERLNRRKTLRIHHNILY